MKALEVNNSIIIKPMTVGEFAQQAQIQVNEVILTLLKQGVVANKNQVLPINIVEKLAQLYSLKIEKPTADIVSSEPIFHSKNTENKNKDEKERLPIVVVIGHVDHGKTSLLDYIRKTRVAAKEKGGITQHLGAYKASTSQGDLIFLDTPGHEAFTMMRQRGLKVADIAILVVAADDGVMPQTLEAIRLAKGIGLPIIVAINKIDKVSKEQIEHVKQQLAQHDLTPEDWGGNTICMPISAKLGTGIEELLEVVVLQSQIMELKADINASCVGYILESKVQKGRGPVATVICRQGILKLGDLFVAGSQSGRISSLVDDTGKQVKEVMPSMPVQIAGFEKLPQAGDILEITDQNSIKQFLSGKSAEGSRLDKVLKKSINDDAINLILKTDSASSREALLSSIEKLSLKFKRSFSIISAEIGDINESDVILASDTNALIYTLHVKSLPNVTALITKHKITVKYFDIIYKLLENLEELAESNKPVVMVSKKIGEASVLKVFDIKNLGIIAGAHVQSGRFVKGGKVIVYRGKQKVGAGIIKGLQRDKKAVKEVHTGFECAFLVEGFDTWIVGDRVECYQETPAE